MHMRLTFLMLKQRGKNCARFKDTVPRRQAEKRPRLCAGCEQTVNAAHRPVGTGFGLPGNKTKGWNVFPIKRMRSEGGTDYETLEKTGRAGGFCCWFWRCWRQGTAPARRRGYGPKTLGRSGFSGSGRAALLCDSAGQCHPIWTLVGDEEYLDWRGDPEAWKAFTEYPKPRDGIFWGTMPTAPRPDGLYGAIILPRRFMFWSGCRRRTGICAAPTR